VGPTHRLAIDLGTCHTVAVVRRGDEAPRALLFDGSPVMASGIYADESGRLSVGRDAERLSQLAPERFEPYPKRSVDEGSVLLGAVEVTVVEMLASLLRRAAEESLQAGVNPVGSTVLTCPADWGGQRRGVLLEAARAANLGPVVLVDEPIAAATYCLRVLGQQVAPLQSLAVFDFGGGTLDVSVVRREFDGLRVLGVGGLDDLGGVDIDAALVGHLGQLINLRHPEIWQRLANPDSTAAHRDRRALWTEVRAAKEMLSRASSAPIHVPGTEEALHLTREELERVAGPLIDRAVDETRRVLERAGIDVRQLAGIFLVGGSSRIPLVASRLHARFGVAPVVPEQPELPVAYGGMLAVATTPQQFDAPPVQPPRPVSGSPGGFQPQSPYPVSAPFPTPSSPAAYGSSATPMPPGSYGSPGAPSPGAYGSPGGPSAQTFASAPPTSAPPSSGPPAGPGYPAQGFPGSPPGASGVSGAPGAAGAGFAGSGPRPPMPPFSPQQPAGGAYGSPFPVVVRPRRRAGPWIALVIVLALIGSCVWGGNKLFGWMGDQFQSVKDNFPGTSATDEKGNLSEPKVDGLKQGKPIEVGGDVGVFTAVAGAGKIYVVEATADTTKVTAYATTDDSPAWALSVPMSPDKVTARLVGNLLLIDGDNDSAHGGKDVRSVIDVSGSGKALWTDTWDNRLDLSYIKTGTGIDAIVEVRSSPSSLQRVDLMTKTSKWTHPGENTFFINGQRTAKPALTWARAADAGDLTVPTYELTFSGLVPVQQSFGADPTSAVHFESGTKATVVNLADGKTKASATIKNDRDGLFVAFAGILAIRSADSDNLVTGYNLRDLSKAWDFKAPPGTDVSDLRPCGEKVLCAIEDKSTDKTLVGIGIADGKQLWTKGLDDPNWYVVDGQLLLGKGSFNAVEAPTVADPSTGGVKYSIGSGLNSPSVYAAGGGKLAILTVRISGGDTVWQVSVAGLTNGKVVGSADVSKDITQNISISADSVVAVDDKGHLIRRYGIPQS